LLQRPRLPAGFPLQGDQVHLNYAPPLFLNAEARRRYYAAQPRLTEEQHAEIERARSLNRDIVMRIKRLETYLGPLDLLDAPFAVRRELSNLLGPLSQLKSAELNTPPKPFDFLDSLILSLNSAVKCLRRPVRKPGTTDKSSEQGAQQKGGTAAASSPASSSARD
jgi:hypothetical protein